MPCYHPIEAFKPLDGGKIIFNERLATHHKEITIPCGQCVGCRLERSRQWAVRCVHEAQLYSSNCFITLTYSDDHLPPDNSLFYPDFQNFMKRLRFKFSGIDSISFNDTFVNPIRFYMCGEYGDDFGRPHFHACLFNFDFPDKQVFFKTSAGSIIYRSKVLEELWPYGFSTIGDVNFASAAYVARYIMKKVTGSMAHHHYWDVNYETGELLSMRKPEFNKMSLKPGIGALWFDKFQSDVYPSDMVVINGKRCKPPRYYDKLYAKALPFDFDEIKFKRECSALQHSADMTKERLAVREQVQLARLSSLKRNLK